jgi:pimeloyl-ACP methyl ester carboxylesterase
VRTSDPAADGEDFLVDADDIANLMGDGAHLVGHSYGGLGAIAAAARRPEATRSLTLLEPPAAMLGQAAPAWEELLADVGRLWAAMAGRPLNESLRALWRSTDAIVTS